MNARLIWIMAATLGFLGVALGAFGAHALKAHLTAAGRVETYELAVRYLFYHALALFATGFLSERFPHAHVGRAALLLAGGVVLFSGSLLILSLAGWTGVALVTPLGGVLMLAGWAWLIYSLATRR
jgi:uncharacterized membrane protein YgdD (TMEM256/DUF423 family)